ncbi:flowering time control protein FCA-like isoform X1 [Chenopodium quinoa]|uniref:flowering time control protein FCA-like isoform X1 n=1 Tax=Chenopodium quinoa TaxID=63459 RepID=UPI000B78C49D|nr:flowering time control protein FCA-like isoform X1 [Chenopodium quinoa]
MMERHRGDRDRDRDRDRDYRDRDRNFHHQQRRPSRFSDGPPVDHSRSPGNYRGGFSGSRRGFESPPRQLPPVSDNGGFHHPPVGGFWRLGGDVGAPEAGFGNELPVPPRPMPMPQQPTPSIAGQKRGFPFSGRGASPEHFDGKNFVKLFVGSVPRTVTEEEIRPLFEEQGKVLEVALIKDKRTGQQQGCCFIKYGTSEEADRAIRALHNQYTLPGGLAPIQVRYADGERERLGNGTVEYKLFVGSLNKLATEKEVEEIFAPYGRIEDVYLMRDERKQSRGCGFVKFSSKDSAMAAINTLNGIFTMRGCDQPLIVRFADPKRPRAGEPRANPAFGSPGFGPSPPQGIRPASGINIPVPMGGRGPPNAWQPMSPQNLGPSPSVGVHGFGNQFPPRSGDTAISATPGSHFGPGGRLTEASIGGTVPAASTSPQNFKQSFSQVPPSGQQISPLQKPLESPQHIPTPLQLRQGAGTYNQAPVSQASVRPHYPQAGVQAPYSQPYPLQQLHGSTGSMPTQFQAQQSATTPMTIQPRPNAASTNTNSQLPTSTPQQPLPYQQSPSQITQMLSQQRQNLQASFQSSQLAFSQLQQQVQMMQPSMHNQPVQQNFQASRQQSQWAGATPTTASSTPAVPPPSDTPSTSSTPVASAAARPAPVKCNWTEHTSPDGYKYYYNSITGESRWVKPEELALYEQQQQKPTALPPSNQPSLLPNQQATQSQPPQFQTQFRNTEQLQNPPLSSMYQAPRGMGNVMAQEASYPQLQAPANLANARFQQGPQAAQEWNWKSNSGGQSKNLNS